MTRLIDPFERAVTYLRVSVTDRCDFRCNRSRTARDSVYSAALVSQER